MNLSLEQFAAADSRIAVRDMIASLQRALEQSQKRVLERARRQWERTYGYADPANACVTVRITRQQPKRQLHLGAGLN